MKSLSILCVGEDSGWKIRTRDVLRETFYKPKLRQLGSVEQCYAALKEGEDSYSVIIVRSNGEISELESFIGEISSFDLPRLPLLLVSLQGNHQTSSHVGALYALGYHGILAEPFSSSQVLQIFGVAAERLKDASESQEVNLRAASFILREALTTLDEVAKNLLLRNSGGRPLVKLRKTSTTLRRFLGELEEERVADLVIKRVEKHLEDADFSVHNRQTKIVVPKHPGKQLKSIMEERGLEPERLASLLKIEEEHLLAILEEQANVDEQLAVALSRVIGQAPDYWLGRKMTARR